MKRLVKKVSKLYLDYLQNCTNLPTATLQLHVMSFFGQIQLAFVFVLFYYKGNNSIGE